MGGLARSIRSSQIISLSFVEDVGISSHNSLVRKNQS